MEVTTISSKFQLVIPRKVCEQFYLKPGQKVVFLPYKKTLLTVRVPRELLVNVKRYAAEHNNTLTGLIEAYHRRIPAGQSLENAPIVRRLSGTLRK